MKTPPFAQLPRGTAPADPNGPNLMMLPALRPRVGRLARRFLGLLAMLIASTAMAQPAATAYAQPMISAFAPGSGPAGTVVTVQGSGFIGARLIWLGADRSIVPTVISDSQLRFKVSSQATTASVAVLTPQRAAFSPTPFTVGTRAPPPTVPVISGFTPASGPPGTRVTVNGSGLAGAVSATIGSAPSVPVTVSSSTRLSFIVPSAAAGGRITVATATASAVSSASYTVTTSPPPPAAMGAIAASRLLSQGGFGGSPASVASTALMSYDQWFAA